MAETTGIQVCRICRDVLTDVNRVEVGRLLCKECRNIWRKARYIPKGRPERSGPAPAAPRDGDKRQARKRVNQLVLCGKLPRPSDILCFDCGHLGTGRRHEYDHFQGYAAAHHLDVQPVCTTCHHKRERDRAPLMRQRSESGRFARG